MIKTEDICERIFALAKGVQTEAFMVHSAGALTRFADNEISQNVYNDSSSVSIRFVDSGRTAKITLNQFDRTALERAVKTGLETLKWQKKDKNLLPLAGPRPLERGRNVFSKETAELPPLYRAQKINDLVRTCKKNGQIAYGTLENGLASYTVANSRGVFAKHLESYITYSVTVRDGDGFGWAETPAATAGDIDFEAVNRTARLKAAMGRKPRDIKPGLYPVILEPAAAADLLSYLCVFGFGGQFYNEGSSFVSGNLGKNLLSPRLSIEDNALDGPAPGMPFDFEGQPRSRVFLVEKGTVKAVVHDRKTAAAAKTASTGHSLPQPNGFTPFPLNVSVHPGESSVEEMIKNSKKAVLITQFHYTNLLRPLSVEMTGMTRNGTFLVENGKISKPLKNLRFTQSMVKAFRDVEAVGRKAELCQVWGRLSCPAFKLKAFNFSSATEF
ncbi:MAG: TldD/PmbA family protein [Elusimicrobia bacterium]|nr:TldD/PmbA family protein [Elusimicrobiota bacterium]